MTITELRRLAAIPRAYDEAAREARADTRRFWAAEYYANKALVERQIARSVIAAKRERVAS